MSLFNSKHTQTTAQLDEMARAIDRFANGDFSGTVPAGSGLAARLTPSMQNLQDQLIRQRNEATALATALAELTKAHEAGAIDAVIPADTLAEPYRSIGANINALVASHINVKMKIVEIVTQYANGDFSVDMDRLPGKKAIITDAIDKAKSSFEDVAAQVSASAKFIGALDEMSRQHVLGWIDACIPVKDFTGDYRTAAELVNALVQSHIDVKMKVVSVVSRYATGDFSIAMDRLPGKKAQITEAIDRVKSSFESMAAEVVAVVASAVRGDFSARGDATKYEHEFKTMVEGLNTLMETADVGLNEVVRVLGALAKGDLTEMITNHYVGTFGRLKDDSNATVDSLTKTVIEIKEAAEIVSTSAREISAGNGDLSQRTEEQAASLEETAASMEEFTATVHQNAENAKHANELAIGASTIALKGGRVVNEVVETMTAINDSSKKIVDIISVIDGIAFQTNILALNAAVEAARAGEQGRGFAVVAGEVRTLAQRSAAAAKEIKALIGDSVDKATTGSKLVDEAGQTMAEIVASVKRVTDIMAAIAAASAEQGTGIEQVNEAVVQMDKVTQQNAALVEQISASAQSLEERSAELVDLVSVFTLADAPGGSFKKLAPSKAASAGGARTLPAPKGAKRGEGTAVAAARAPARRPTPASVDESDWSSF